MNLTYKVKFSKKSIKFLSKQDRKTREKVKNHIWKLSENPFKLNNVKVLRGDMEDYRLRIGKIRVIYKIYNDVMVILIAEIGYRGDIYK